MNTDPDETSCPHYSKTRYVGCGGRAFWICDGCERVTGEAERETSKTWQEALRDCAVDADDLAYFNELIEEAEGYLHQPNHLRKD